MIGGLIALKIDPAIMTQLGRGKRRRGHHGTNGKSTTTRMTATALATLGDVATQAGSSIDLDRGRSGCAYGRDAGSTPRVDELHVPHVADAVNPEVIVLLNLSRDQLDRVGEIMIERKLRVRPKYSSRR